MAFVRKIKASLVRIDVEDYIGEQTYLFYDIVTGDLRIWDGSPGGLSLISGGGGATNWGGIGGTLSNQTDLQAALDAAGAQAWGTITGTLSDQTDLQAALDAAGTQAWGTITGNIVDQTDLSTALDTAGDTAVWGNITGTLADQTDLNTAINNAAITTWGDVVGTITDQTDLTAYIDNATEEEMFAQQIDFINDDLLYRAEATPGTATNAALWRIRKITIDNAGEGDVETTWADGNDNFDNIWDDHLSLTYT